MNGTVLGMGGNGKVEEIRTRFGEVRSGELIGTLAAVQLPDVPCAGVMFKADLGNSGKVYIGGPGVSKPDAVTDTTTGWPLASGEETGWIPVDNLNRLYRICDSPADEVFYLAVL